MFDADVKPIPPAAENSFRGSRYQTWHEKLGRNRRGIGSDEKPFKPTSSPSFLHHTKHSDLTVAGIHTIYQLPGWRCWDEPDESKRSALAQASDKPELLKTSKLQRPKHMARNKEPETTTPLNSLIAHCLSTFRYLSYTFSCTERYRVDQTKLTKIRWWKTKAEFWIPNEYLTGRRYWKTFARQISHYIPSRNHVRITITNLVDIPNTRLRDAK